jgi:hypothetical protein
MEKGWPLWMVVTRFSDDHSMCFSILRVPTHVTPCNIYKNCIQNEINNLEKEHQPVNFKIKQLDQMLHKAGAKAIPKYRKLKSLKT